MMVRAPSVRFRIEPGDIPAEKVARRLHLTSPEFADRLPALLRRGFPPPDPDTGMFDLEAGDRWRHLRHRHLFPESAAAEPAREPEPRPSMGQRFVESERARREAQGR